MSMTSIIKLSVYGPMPGHEHFMSVLF